MSQFLLLLWSGYFTVITGSKIIHGDNSALWLCTLFAIGGWSAYYINFIQ